MTIEVVKQLLIDLFLRFDLVQFLDDGRVFTIVQVSSLVFFSVSDAMSELCLQYS